MSPFSICYILCSDNIYILLDYLLKDFEKKKFKKILDFGRFLFAEKDTRTIYLCRLAQ